MKNKSKRNQILLDSNNLSTIAPTSSKLGIEISNGYFKLTHCICKEQAGGGSFAANESNSVPDINQKNTKNSLTDQVRVKKKINFKQLIDKQLFLAKSLFKNDLSFPNNNRLPQCCLEDLFQVCHLPKSTRKKFNVEY